MQASSYDEGEDELNVNEGSLNETANSVHFQVGERDKDMAEINNLLQEFILHQLLVIADFEFEGLQSNKLITQRLHVIIKPKPFVYFLPSSILFLERREDIQRLHNRLDNLNKQEYQIRYDRDKKELNIIVHSHLQLLHYNLRCLKTDQRQHRDPRMLDSKYLIDKLYQYYQKFYASLYFRQTTVLMLYWAYQHDLLNHTISQQALKLIVICIFINFGYGVNNIVSIESQNPQKLKECKKMYSYSRINSRGETQIQEGLQAQFFNYTIQQKKGFFMLSKKRHMQIKDVVPVFYPVLPLRNTQEEHQLARDIKHSIRGVLEHERQNMSICKNISKIFKFLYNKFDKQMKFVIDFGQKVAYRHQFSENFELQVVHPVLNTSICRLKDSQMKLLKRQINQIHERFNKNEEPLQIMKHMFDKVRR